MESWKLRQIAENVLPWNSWNTQSFKSANWFKVCKRILILLFTIWNQSIGELITKISLKTKYFTANSLFGILRQWDLSYLVLPLNSPLNEPCTLFSAALTNLFCSEKSIEFWKYFEISQVAIHTVVHDSINLFYTFWNSLS